MTRTFKFKLLLVFFMLVSVASTQAAKLEKGYDKYGRPLPSSSTAPVEFPRGPKPIPPVQVTERPIPNATEDRPTTAVELPEQVVPHRGQSGHYECDFPYGCKATGPGFAAFTCQLYAGVWRDCQEVQKFCYDESQREQPYEPQLYRQHCFV